MMKLFSWERFSYEGWSTHRPLLPSPVLGPPLISGWADCFQVPKRGDLLTTMSDALARAGVAEKGLYPAGSAVVLRIMRNANCVL